MVHFLDEGWESIEADDQERGSTPFAQLRFMDELG